MSCLIIKIGLFCLIGSVLCTKMQSKSVIQNMVDVPNMVKKFGFECEEHTVQTRDGYMLTIFRLPSRINEYDPKFRPAVLLQHGFLSNAASWLVNGPHESIPLELVNAGFDVWLGNTRENSFGRRHLKFNPESSEFWKFSLDEIAKYDIPAIINYISQCKENESNEKLSDEARKINIIAFDQGFTTSMMQLSQDPSLNSKIKILFIYGIMSDETYDSYPFLRFLKESSVEDLNNMFKEEHVLLNADEYIKLVSKICEKESKLENILCADPNDFLYFLGGNFNNINKDKIQSYLPILVDGTSKNVLLHYSQILKSNKMQTFDSTFGSGNPKDYKFSNIRCSVVVFSGDIQDPWRYGGSLQLNSIPSKIRHEIISDYGYFDFVLADNLSEHVIPRLIEILKKEK